MSVALRRKRRLEPVKEVRGQADMESENETVLEVVLVRRSVAGHGLECPRRYSRRCRQRR